ncbi:TetR/AcrR family transcriptional regulator [Nocardia sp. NBC_00508]|uniref:TetR/AcrR family transcriptional regulator n=1 Tax=Nocardia sp. NBC_00508 TaxID=2975992 RepID=UPI002E816E84|nr:TetR/AcrR family transcriptional regulator [Nocardia sp. NBC_00508]WUD66052.1 TetR/AcrR family transcriptional regulator [Nocardia sp. NBC_00508]
MSSHRAAGAAVLRKRVTETIARAAFDELAETGYARLSMEAVTRRAGVGKAALYRRWPSKDAMLIDLVSTAVREHSPADIDTGSLRGDVEAFIRDVVDMLTHELVSRIVPDLFAEAARNRDLADALREAVATPRRAAAAQLLQRAVDRGELPTHLDYELGMDLLGAPLFFRLLITRGSVDNGYVARLTNATTAALAAAE